MRNTGVRVSTGAKVVVIGAGVVGASAAHHLTRLGWTDVTVVEQGPLFATGGSSSHAPGLVFQTNPSKSMTELARATVELYGSLDRDGDPCFLPVGGIEVATTPERWLDLARKHGLATAWGIDAELLDPGEVTRRIPAIDTARVLGGLLVASDGVAKSVRAVEALCRAAQRRGATLLGGTEVTGCDVTGGRVRAVETSRGRIEAEVVLCCAGIWGTRVGRLAGVTIPVQPLGHQYARTTPLAAFAGATAEIAQPILRHQDRAMYFRQLGDAYGVGSYQHRAMAIAAEDIPSHAQAARGEAGAHPPGGEWGGMPSTLAFTPEDFKQPWQDACELLPALRDTRVAEAMNGLFLFTADGLPVLGESREVAGFWVAEAVWVTHSGGVGRCMAEWLVDGKPSIDLREADLHRFEDFQHSPAYVRARGEQSFREVYDIIHPLQPMEQPRPLRVSPFHQRQRELGAVFLEASGWERPHWFEANQALLETLGDQERAAAGGRAYRTVPPRSGWSARHWSPIVAAEHLATRARVALYDMTPLKKLEVSGPGALGLLQRLTSNQLERPLGSVTYTLLLDDEGGVRSDLTVARLGTERFQVGANGPLDLDWIARRLPLDGSVAVRDITAATCCLGLWGPRARDLLTRLAPEDLGHEAFGYFRAHRIHVGEIPVDALRLSYVGELGWELYCSAEHGLRMWDLLWDAGQAHGLIAGGRGAFNGLRIEKGYRSWGLDVWAEHTPDEAGLGFAVRMGKGDFVGRDALLRRQPTRRLACLTLDDPAAVVLGKEPVLADGRPAGFVTSAAHGYAVGASIAYAWLPVELAEHGRQVDVVYFGERLGATVADDPLFDPGMERMRR